MGKKKKVDINGTPLEAITIGQIKQNRFGWIGMIILFALFGGVIYFLPEITKFYQDYISGGVSVGGNIPINNTVSNTTEEPSGEEEPIVSETLYSFGTDVIVNYENLEFTQISYVNNVLTFNVTNKSTASINLNNSDLYFETYDTNAEARNTLNTIALKGVIPVGETAEKSYEINGGATYFSIYKILEEDYTYIDLTPDENNNILLTCVKGQETVAYSFFHDKLKTIENTVVVSKSDANYDLLYSRYNTLVVKYGSINGIKTSLSTNMLNMTFKMHIDYGYFTNTIENDYYFAKDTSPRVVYFKMESELFECS